MIEGEKVKFRGMIDKISNVLLVSHRRPDSDTLGSALAIKFWLKSLGKNVTTACIDKPSKIFSFLPEVGEFVTEFNSNEYDLIVIVDCGASYMTNFHLKYPDFFDHSEKMVNIDHHASNDMFAAVNIVDVNAASATVIIYNLFVEWGIVISEDMATALLAGIYGDTGSFMHSNTSKEVFDIAAELMTRGARVAEISKALFRSNSVSTLKLWGNVLENVQITDDNVVMGIVNDEDYKMANASPDQLSGVIDYLNMVPGSKFAVLINEDRNGNVKGSFRTRNEEVDLSRIAAVFGGGGHPKASGFSMKGKLEREVRYKIVSEDMSKRSLEF